MADRRVVTVVGVVSWPVLVVSAMWPPADYVMTGFVLVLAVVGAVWGGLYSAGQSVVLWWETVKALRPPGGAR
jgi:hypothetical protein